MLNPLAWCNAAAFWILGGVVLYHVLSRWKNPEKQASKYSEILYVFYFAVLGYYVLRLFEEAPVRSGYIFHGILLVFIIAVVFWLLVINVLPNYRAVQKNPTLRQTRNYEQFIIEVNQKYTKGTKDDVVKDFSRKILHFIQFTGIVIIHVAAFEFASVYAPLGINPFSMRNFLYVMIASFFIFMFMVADLYRMTNFSYLPDWAHRWYAKSLEPRNETWTYNAAAPILLANLLFTHPIVPVPVFLSATFISCVADALASMVGKFYGRHKLIHFGRFPHKSYEGLLAGMIASFIGVTIIFLAFPIAGLSSWQLLGCGVFAMVTFLYTDAFARYIGDNVLNSLISGIGFLLIVFIF
jgi:dolichol kinase